MNILIALGLNSLVSLPTIAAIDVHDIKNCISDPYKIVSNLKNKVNNGREVEFHFGGKSISIPKRYAQKNHLVTKTRFPSTEVSHPSVFTRSSSSS